MPSHETARPPQNPSMIPLAVLITLDGMGSSMSAASNALNTPATTHQAGSLCMNAAVKRSMRCSNRKNGTTMTSSMIREIVVQPINLR